jgi:hypothetical protein
MKPTLKPNIKDIQNALIYTKEAIARLLGVLAKSIIRTMVWWSGFWILIKGKRPKLYKKSLFQQHFSNFRKQSATNYTVVKTDSKTYRVSPIAQESPTDNTKSYLILSTAPNGLLRYTCGCQDYRTMSEAFKAPACKHIYAVLATQGFGSLKEAIDANTALATAALEAKLAIGL